MQFSKGITLQLKNELIKKKEDNKWNGWRGEVTKVKMEEVITEVAEYTSKKK